MIRLSTYVVSDIHGLRDRYNRMLEGIHFCDQDHLYVLGDVIDRGYDSMGILLDIRKRKNVTMLLGNHEHMMVEYIQSLSNEEMDEIRKYKIMDCWKRNHNEQTLAQFLELSTKQQKEVIEYLVSLPIAICDLKVKKQRYYLVHGYPCMEFKEGKITREMLKGKGIPIEDLIWNRIEFEQEFFRDRCLIFGHTPTLYLQNVQPYEIWTGSKDIKETTLMNVDCGCASNDKNTRLACLCLDTRKVFYF